MKLLRFGACINVITFSLILTILTLVENTAFASPDDPVYFADEKLKAKIEYVLDVIDPTEANMLELTYLDIDDESLVENITGLEYAINLEHLNIANPYISDFTSIYNLTKLSYLNMSHANIDDISFLANMVNMEQLNISGTNTADISVLAGMTHLTYLWMVNNPLNEEAYQLWLPTIETNNPMLHIRYDPYIRNDVMLFADQNLEMAVEDALGKTDPTPADMLNLKSLIHTREEEDYLSIHDLSGLEYAVNLEYLDLSGNSINDLTPLSGMMKLKYLNLSHCGMTSLDAIANLPLLEELYFFDSNISDFSVLSNLTTLTHLQLTYHHINDPGFLANLTNITWLNLERCWIPDLTPLTSMPNLTHLYLNECEGFSDWGPLEYMTSLTELNLDYCDIINDLTPLANLTSLVKLHLSGNNIRDLSPLANLHNLQYLILNLNKIYYIDTLANLTNLVELQLNNNIVYDLSPLAALTKLEILELGSNHLYDLHALPVIESLRVLNLSHNEITSNEISNLEFLENMTGLRYLNLNKNDIFDLNPLSNLVNLEKLQLAENDIQDISPLAGLSKLKELDLDRNLITSLPSLGCSENLTSLSLSLNSLSNIDNISNLTELENLNLAHNNISDISPLANLKELNTVLLDFNNISDISPLAEINKMKYLYLNDNPLFPEAYTRWISEIKNNSLYNIDIRYSHYSGDPMVMVISPNGSEQFADGREIEISWGSVGINYVAISISIDEGESWVILDTVPSEDINRNVYYWETPEMNLNKCLIRVSSTNMTYADTSDNTFSIFHCGLKNSDGDINNDCKVDIYDLAAIAENWLRDGICVYLYYDFEDELPVDNWSYNSTGNGLIQVADGKLRMEATDIGEGSLNEAILHVNLSGRENAVLSFSHKAMSDERETKLPDRFSGSYIGDGVSLSSDGIHWRTIYDYIDLDTGSEEKQFSFEINHYNYEYTEDFQIKFQQYDNCLWPIDGRCWDDISVTSNED